MQCRKIIGVAVDTPSTDRGQSREFETHQVLGKYNLWGIENLANAEALPLNGSLIYNMVDNIKEGSGAPTRVFAVLYELTSTGTRTSNLNFVVAILCSVFLLALTYAAFIHPRL